MVKKQIIWEILQSVPDPEIPVISVVDLGIIQSVDVDPTGQLLIQITPTFAGCPAIEMMRDDIRAALQGAGIENAQIEVVLSPAWSSDRITEEGRRKLREFGLAPPPPIRGQGDGAMIMLFETAQCPFCDSTQTHLQTPFGPTLCRAIYFCDNCKQSFEMFKPL